jgi:CheY-like chemotaxis protein
VANNGKEALHLVEKESFDLVLMDVQMPVMDGLNATVAIREKEKKKNTHIPIIAMTAHAMREDIHRCLDAGMDVYISKPIDTEQLFNTMENLVMTTAGKKETAFEKEETSIPGQVSTESKNDGKVIDRTKILDNYYNKSKLFKKITEKFFDKYPRMLSDINQAFLNGDFKAIQDVAHSLKGSIGCFAAHSALEAALNVEMIGRNEDTDHAEEAFERLKKEIEYLKRELIKIEGENILNK